MAKHKGHLQDLLVQRGLAHTTQEAERLILGGRVNVEGTPVYQAGLLVEQDAHIELSQENKYVSRGGIKLEAALRDFALSPQDLRCIDCGASTGGFTDCLLQAGAAQVTAVDVGYGQFDWRLRNDARVALFERTNIAKVAPADLGAPFDLLVADLSFISLARLAAQFVELVGAGDARGREGAGGAGTILALVKPQFELPKAAVKDGVVRSFDLHVTSLQLVREAYENVGLHTKGMSYSPLLGPKGNREFWIWAAKDGVTATIDPEDVVRRAHETL